LEQDTTVPLRTVFYEVMVAPRSALANGMDYIDLGFLGRPQIIATAVLKSAAGVGLIDPGPSTTLGNLKEALRQQGIEIRDVRQVLLTHIHLDHAGATGSLLVENPEIEVAVHEMGAGHLADPSRLLASATRLYGEDMDRFWGPVLPVPAERLRVLSGGERVPAAGRDLDVAYTPGHASHHVSYFDRSSGVAFVGDTGGVSIDGGYILPPTPPPDIDIEAWRESVMRIEAWAPATLFMTHFGPVNNPTTHLRTLMQNLDTMAGLVRARLSEPGTDDEQGRRFAEDLVREWQRHMTDAQVAAYKAAAPPELVWMGLARYWRKKLAGSL
jgi:glyoxylase-like metal-dependent hydrolase (beta-lactamase superfamily II)